MTRIAVQRPDISSDVGQKGVHSRFWRKRYWVFYATAAVIGLPLVLYLGAIWYIGFGFLTPRIEKEISTAFGSTAKIGNLKTNWLQNIRVENVVVDSPESKGVALTVGAVDVDWNLYSFARENKIRNVTIDRPDFSLICDDQGKWNLNLVQSEHNQGAAYHFDEVQIKNGGMNLAWPPQRSLHLQNLGVTFQNKAPDAPRPFMISGALESQEKFSASGNWGPHSALDLTIAGGTYPNKDFASALGADAPSGGHINYNFSLKSQAPSTPANKPDKISLKGKLAFENLIWQFVFTKGSERSITLENRSFDLTGTVIPEYAADKLFSIKDMDLASVGLGGLSADCRVESKPLPHFIAEQGHGKLGMEYLNAIFLPRLTGPDTEIAGDLNVSGLKFDLPLSGPAPFKLTADLETSNADIRLIGVGTLPQGSAKASVDWPALHGGSITFGNVAKTTIEIADMNPDDEKNYWTKFFSGVRLQNFQLDLGQFCESEFGRRFIGAVPTSEKNVPATDKLPFALKGTLNAAHVKLSSESATDGQFLLTLSPLQINRLAVKNWNLPLKIPRQLLTGEITASALVKEDCPRELTAGLKFTGKQSAADAMDSALGGVSLANSEGDITAKLFADASGKWTPGPVTIKKLAIPLGELARISEDVAHGVSGSGDVIITEGFFEPAIGNAGGTIYIKTANVEFTLSPPVQKVMASALKLTKYGSLSAILEQYPLEKLGLDIHDTTFHAGYKNQTLDIQGQTRPMDIHIPLPIFGDYKVASIPPVEFSLRLDTTGSASEKCVLNLKFDDKNKLTLLLRSNKENPGLINASGSFALSAPGITSAQFDVPLDLNKNEIGKAVLTINEINGANLQEMLISGGLPAQLAERAPRKFRLEMDPATLDSTARSKVYGTTMFWDDASHLRLTLTEDPGRGNAEADLWILRGELSEAKPGGGGFNASFDAPLDFRLNKCGKSTGHIENIDMKDAGTIMRAFGLPDFSLAGRLEKVNLELAPAYFTAITGQRAGKLNISAKIQDGCAKNPQGELSQLSAMLTSDVDSTGDSVIANVAVKLDSYEAFFADGKIHIPHGKDGEIHLNMKCLQRYDGSDLLTINNCDLNLENRVYGSVTGSVATEPNGTFSEADFSKVSLNIPDVNFVRKTTSMPSIEGLVLRGNASFLGRMSWLAGREAKLSGVTTVNDFMISAGPQFSADGLFGKLPLILQHITPVPGKPIEKPGTAAPAASDSASKVPDPDITAQISFGSIHLGSLIASAQSLNCVASLNSLRIESPLKIQSSGDAVSIEKICLNCSPADHALDLILTAAPIVDIKSLLSSGGISIDRLDLKSLRAGDNLEWHFQLKYPPSAK